MHRLAWKIGEKVSITDTKGKKEDISTFFLIFFDLRQIRIAEFKTEKRTNRLDWSSLPYFYTGSSKAVLMY